MSPSGKISEAMVAVLKEAADFIQPFNRAADLLDRMEAVIAALSVPTPSTGGADKWLGELLAIIHRDGGQYQATHGVEKAVEDAHSILSALSSTPVGEMDVWRPMGTAPKDGTWVLVRLSNGEVFRASWHVYGAPGWHVSSDIGFVNARHWMPLPASPQGGR